MYVDLGCVDNIFVAIDDSDQIIHLVWWLILTSVIHMVLLYVLSEHVDRPTYSVIHDKSEDMISRRCPNMRMAF